MKIIFIRHGQGEHTLSPPESLQMSDATLTEKGVQQAQQLKQTFPLTNKDIIIISPTRRTIETALIWAKEISCTLYVHPLVSPRMFPLLNPDQAYACDQILHYTKIKTDYPSLHIIESSEEIWTNGINTISEEAFHRVAKAFMSWCKQLNQHTLYIVSHDGTINAYRSFLGESVTRDHFLDESGSYIVHL